MVIKCTLHYNRRECRLADTERPRQGIFYVWDQRKPQLHFQYTNPYYQITIYNNGYHSGYGYTFVAFNHPITLFCRNGGKDIYYEVRNPIEDWGNYHPHPGYASQHILIAKRPDLLCVHLWKLFVERRRSQRILRDHLLRDLLPSVLIAFIL